MLTPATLPGPGDYPSEYRPRPGVFCRHPWAAARLRGLKGRYAARKYLEHAQETIVRSLANIKRRCQGRERLPLPVLGRPFSRTTASSRAEYDACGPAEHDLYDAGTPIAVDRCGAMVRLSFRDYRDYLSGLIADEMLSPRGNFLDVGAGNGFNARYLSRRFPETRIVAIDVSAHRLAAARAWMGRPLRVSFVQMDGAHLAFPDNSFDLVYSCHALEQMESIIEQALSEIIRVTKRRAVLIEPVYELGSTAQRIYLRSHDYTRSILQTLKSASARVTILKLHTLGIQGNPLNQSSLIVLEKIGR